MIYVAEQDFKKSFEEQLHWLRNNLSGVNPSSRLLSAGIAASLPGALVG